MKCALVTRNAQEKIRNFATKKFCRSAVHQYNYDNWETFVQKHLVVRKMSFTVQQQERMNLERVFLCPMTIIGGRREKSSKSSSRSSFTILNSIFIFNGKKKCLTCRPRWVIFILCVRHKRQTLFPGGQGTRLISRVDIYVLFSKLEVTLAGYWSYSICVFMSQDEARGGQ